MSSKVPVQATFEFIRAGDSPKNGRPYLIVSNGRNQVFVDIPKSVAIDSAIFDKYSDGDDIELTVDVLPGSDKISFRSLVE